MADVLKKAYPELMEKYPNLFETAEEDDREIVYYVLMIGTLSDENVGFFSNVE